MQESKNHKLQNYRQEVIKNIDRITGLTSDHVFEGEAQRIMQGSSLLKKFEDIQNSRGQQYAEKDSLLPRPNSELVKPKNSSIANLKGVSGRFNPNCDVDNQRSFVFVNQTSTAKEKMLAMRASLICNQKGVKVNGKELSSPPPKMMEKISRAQRFASSQKTESLKSTIGPDSS